MQKDGDSCNIGLGTTINMRNQMRMKLKYFLLCLFIACGLVACSDDTVSGVGSNDSNSSNNNPNEKDGSDTGTSTDQSDVGVVHRSITAVEITPADVVLTSVDGAEVTQDLKVSATYSDGTTTPYSGLVEWSIDDQRLGRIGERDGEFKGNGLVGGTATVTAKLDGVSVAPATTTLTIMLERTVMGSDVPADVANLFATGAVTDPAREAEIVYPLENAVMPQNVYPADVQWIKGAQDDIFRLTFSKDNLNVVAYIKHTGAGFGNHWLVDADQWRAMAQTNATAALTIKVDRYEAATQEVISTPPVSMRFADAALSGSVYYWDIDAGRIVRINDGSGTREEFMPTPPISPSGEQCVGCHSVSNDGRYMVGRLGGGYNAGAVFDLTQDLSVANPPTLYPVSSSSAYWNFSTWSPDNTRLIVSGNEWALQGMKLVDPFTGVETIVTGLPGPGSTHPAWSPDGGLLAYVENAGGFGGDNRTGDIAVLEVLGNDTFGARSMIQAGNAIPNASPAGVAASYPTWTPDSQWIAFAHGTGSRSESSQSALYMIKADGTNLVRLDHASGGPDADDTFQPSFSPFHQGGYFWVTYLTRRDYGNAEVGTKGRSLQQIWVSAVSDTPGQSDPSEVGYWLPGQNTASRNISAYWAPRACRMDGEGCAVGAECCSGECTPGPDDVLVCSPPPPERCREISESCNQTADCCGTRVVCEANACTAVIN